jgi:aspartate/methionine/tyrosine aminotransferase
MEQYAQRLASISAFKAMKVLDRAKALEALGRRVIHLEVGEPDFATPAPIVAAAKRALDSGQTKYTPAPGIPELRAAIADHYQSDYGVEVDSQRIFVTAGGSGALLLTMALLIDPGDGVLMTDPGYPCNPNFVHSFNGVAQRVPVTASNNYQLSAASVARHWQDNTRAALVASPANPTGSVLQLAELQDIANEVQRRSGFLIVDEIYHGLDYSEASLPTALEVGAIVLNSFSKFFGMTGWRLGWLIVPESAVPAVEKLAQNLFICPSAISQRAALAAFTPEAKAIMLSQRSAFAERRDLLLDGLRKLGFGVPITPAGAFYVYAELPASWTADSESFCRLLLEEQGIAITPGTDFGTYQADRHVRLSYANELGALEEALAGIARMLQ